MLLLILLVVTMFAAASPLDEAEIDRHWITFIVVAFVHVYFRFIACAFTETVQQELS